MSDITEYTVHPIDVDRVRITLEHQKSNGRVASIDYDLDLKLLELVKQDKAEWVGREIYPFLRAVLLHGDD